jgi:hypothetical protein
MMYTLFLEKNVIYLDIVLQKKRTNKKLLLNQVFQVLHQVNFKLKNDSYRELK